MSGGRASTGRSAGGRHTRVRPRYDRLAAAGVAVATTLVALLGGLGVLPDGGPAAAATGPGPAARLAAVTVPTTPSTPTAPSTPIPDATGLPAAGERDPAATAAAGAPLPEDSGEGRRVVFDISDQHVWLVGVSSEGADEVRRDYPVSGSLTDNLSPGSFEVYSRSRWAVGIDDSGVMEYFVRFTRGDNAAIGFHSIPTKDGRALQTEQQLGTPQSHGCIRQARPDARRLWDFAPVGTKVVVTA